MKANSLYGTVIEYINEGIRSGEFLPDQKIPTEMELVKKFGFSRPTINKALNELNLQGKIYRVAGKGSFVSGEKVVETNTRTTKIISLITPFREGTPYRNDEIEIIRGVEGFLNEKNYFLTLQFTNQDVDIQKQMIMKSWKEGIDGIILYPTINFNDIVLMNELILNDYPFLMLDVNNNGLPVLTVQSDNKQGGYICTKHLIEMGYEDIYFVSDNKINSIASIQDRYLGYRNALKEQNVIFNTEHCIEGYACVEDQVVEFFGYNERPEIFNAIVQKIMERSVGKRVGILTLNDSIANSLLVALKNQEISVPDVVGITTFDDTGLYGDKISYVKQNSYEIGRKAAEMLYKKINGEEVEKETHIPVDFYSSSSTSRIVK